MKVVWQRCFKIPKHKLDLFLVKITSSWNNLSHFEAEYIFDVDQHSYHVIVSEKVTDNGIAYPFLENDIAEFADKLLTGRKT